LADELALPPHSDRLLVIDLFEENGRFHPIATHIAPRLEDLEGT